MQDYDYETEKRIPGYDREVGACLLYTVADVWVCAGLSCPAGLK